MVEIGGKPILWHIMKIYSSYGLNEFVVALGYRGYLIKEYFSNYFLHSANVTFNMASNTMQVHSNESEPWVVSLVETGDQTMTGGRVKRISSFLNDSDEDFCLTYGDGVADVDIGRLIRFHKEHRKMATLTAVQPPGRFGSLALNDLEITGFEEKVQGDGGWINGGFFVLKKKVLDLIENDSTIWERGPLEHLARTQNLMAYRHEGFWQPMDTLREKTLLENLWDSGKAPWKVWNK